MCAMLEFVFLKKFFNLSNPYTERDAKKSRRPYLIYSPLMSKQHMQRKTCANV